MKFQIQLGDWMARCAAVMLLSVAMTHANATQSYEPIRLIGDVTDQVVKALETERSEGGPEEVWAVLDKYVSPYVDYPKVSKFLLGKHRNDLSQTEFERFQSIVKPMLIRAYAVAIGDTDGLLVEHADARWNSDGNRCAVRMRFSKSDAPDTLVEYKLHNSSEGWRLYDVAVAGVSFLSTYRMAIEHEITEHGAIGMMDTLEARLTLAKG